LNLTSQFNEVGFFLEILGNPKISELKNSIWAKLGKSLGDLAEATQFSVKLLLNTFSVTSKHIQLRF